MSNPNNSDRQEQSTESVEVLESYVLGSRVNSILDNPTDVVIAEG